MNSHSSRWLRPLPALLALCCALPATGWAGELVRGRCLLQVGGKTYLNGPCGIRLEPDGSFALGVAESGPITYFAQVSVSGKNVADGFWNEEKGANHAHSPLGVLARKGACWRNASALVCAYR